jgi:hypothetical protein
MPDKRRTPDHIPPSNSANLSQQPFYRKIGCDDVTIKQEVLDVRNKLPRKLLQFAMPPSQALLVSLCKEA